jgi:hypothetical protein
MANTFTAIMPKILARGLMTLREACVMPRLVNGDYSTEAAQKGATIDVPIPSAVGTIDVTPAVDDVAPTDATPAVVQVSLDKWRQSNPFGITDKELLEIDRNRHFVPMQVQEAIRALANYVNAQLLAEYLGIYGYHGTAGTTPFGATPGTSDAITPRKILNQQLAPKDNRRGVVNYDAEANMLALAAFADAEKILSAVVKTEGEIGRKFGIDWVADDACPTHTAGTLSNGSTHTAKVNDAAYTVGETTVDIDETTLTGTVVIGDIFTVAGDTQTYVVTADATAAANAIAGMEFLPASKVAWADDAVVTFRDDHVVNLVFHRDAFAFATRPLASQGLVMPGGNQILSMRDPQTGMVLRLEVKRQHKQTVWEFDIRSSRGRGAVKRPRPRRGPGRRGPMGAIPTVRVTGPGGEIVVNESDLAAYEARGFKLIGDAPPPEAEDKPEAETPEAETPEADPNTGAAPIEE